MAATLEAGDRARSIRRSLDAAAAVALWMAAGWILRLDANTYLLLGVPITVAFQLGIRRRPLPTLWVRDADRFRMDGFALPIAGALAATPAVTLVQYLAATPRPDWTRVAWLAGALLGAFAGGFAFRHFSRATVRDLAGCVATAGIAGTLLILASRSSGAAAAPAGSVSPVSAIRWFLLYLPVTFVLEEVFFRGTIDAHVHAQGKSRGIASAILVSALWGLWHLPIVGARGPDLVTVTGLLFVHCLIGVPLSLYWRRSGNLAVPGTAHAFIDALRNTLLPMR